MMYKMYIMALQREHGVRSLDEKHRDSFILEPTLEWEVFCQELDWKSPLPIPRSHLQKVHGWPWPFAIHLSYFPETAPRMGVGSVSWRIQNIFSQQYLPLNSYTQQWESASLPVFIEINICWVPTGCQAPGRHLSQLYFFILNNPST